MSDALPSAPLEPVPLPVSFVSAPESSQMELFAPFRTSDGKSSRTVAVFDALHPFTLKGNRYVPGDEVQILRKTVRIHHNGAVRELTLRIYPSMIEDPRGRLAFVFPGCREELVARAIRFMAAQQMAKLELRRDRAGDSQPVTTVSFTLYALRKNLAECGHDFKSSQLLEAINVLHGGRLHIQHDTAGEYVDCSSAIFPYLTSRRSKKRGDGSEHQITVSLHPLITAALETVSYFPSNFRRIMSLRMPLSRYLTDRLTHNYRQASRGAGILENSPGYSLLQSTIEAESGMHVEERARNNWATVRKALNEMKAAGILFSMRPYNETPRTGERTKAKGPPPVTDVLWTLFPSRELVEEIISGNDEMRLKKPVKPARQLSVEGSVQEKPRKRSSNTG